ncbi:MAG: serine/threonine-protein kinase, partial [Myxococcota bacterium]
MDQQPQVQRIGRYEVVRKIATGGMAELFLARYSGPGGFEKRCALKRILPQFAADETFTRMFLTEAKVTAQLDHPNIVQIFELGQDENGQYFIAMELVNGVNLRQLLTMAKQRRQPIPPELASYIALQALEGLAYAHEMRDSSGEPLNLVHRDISPQNILVSFEGAVKLVDFGIVKGSSISSETQTGMLKGKVAYMSPEQATGESLDGRSDLFALAVVLYELIAGERPFSAVNELMTLKAILEQPPQPLIQFAPECPDGIERAIFRGLGKYPQQRFINARTFHAELDDVLRACPVPLGRHVVAEFVQSLTEGSTVSFDASRLKIPRKASSVGFSHHLSAGAVYTGQAPAAATPAPGGVGIVVGQPSHVYGNVAEAAQNGEYANSGMNPAPSGSGRWLSRSNPAPAQSHEASGSAPSALGGAAIARPESFEIA